MKTFLSLFVLLISVSSAAEPTILELKVFPKEVNLTTSRDAQTLIVQARYSDETTRDVTGDAMIRMPENLVQREENRFTAKGDGAGEIIVQFSGKEVNVPLKVERAAEDRPISFRLDVMPVFMNAGCNTGGCHGSARGQDGFMLSLFGYDPAGDYHRITREFAGRRINLARPEASLLMTKSLGAVQHTGGETMKKESENYQTLMRWLKAGAPDDAKDVAEPMSMEIMPNRIVLSGKDKTQQLTVRVHYSDGTDRDVTTTAVFLSNNDNAATVSKEGLITATGSGEAFIMARFSTFTLTSQVIVVPPNEFTWTNPPKNNYIDEFVHAKLRKLRMLPSAVCSDEIYIRRVYLDVIGSLPTEQELRDFVADKAPDKRAKLVSSLLNRKEFVEIWVMKWAELLQIRSSNQFSYKSALLYFTWLQEQIAENVPINEIVKKLLSSSGGTFKKPETNYYQVETDRLKVAENVAQVFMGIRLQCAQCHNHPFDRWTMDDYYGWAAFFNRIGRKRAEDPRETIVYDSGSGDTRHPVNNQVMTPKFLGGEAPEIKASTGRRAAVAEWLTSPKNPYFSKNLANITWAHFFGQGIVEPVDDVRISNPASNPELLKALAGKLIEYKYDFRKLVFDICTSTTYQLATQPNDSNAADLNNFAKGPIRRIRAEVLLDCLAQVTETKNKFRGLPTGARAVQIADGRTSTYFLTTFGRATRDTVCSCEVVMEPNLSQALHLLNGENTHAKVKAGNVVGKMLEAKKAPVEIIEDLYLRCFSRKPTEEEKKQLLATVDPEEDKKTALEDVFWALLNSKEFIFNH